MNSHPTSNQRLAYYPMTPLAALEAELKNQHTVILKSRRHGMSHMSDAVEAMVYSQLIQKENDQIKEFLKYHLVKGSYQKEHSLEIRLKKLIDWAEKTRTPIIEEVKAPNAKDFRLTEQGFKKIYGDSTSEVRFDGILKHLEKGHVHTYEKLTYDVLAKAIGDAFYGKQETKDENKPQWSDLAAIYNAGSKGDVVSVLQQMQARQQSPAQRSYLEEDDTSVLCVWIRDGVHHSIRVPAGAPIPKEPVTNPAWEPYEEYAFRKRFYKERYNYDLP